MMNLRFSLPSLFGLVAVVAAGLGAWLNASVSVLTALFILTVVELLLAARGAVARDGATRAFCAGFALAGSIGLVTGCAYLWLAHADLKQPWIRYLTEVAQRPHGWIVRDPVATAAVMCICITLCGAFAVGTLARLLFRRTQTQAEQRCEAAADVPTKQRAGSMAGHNL
jgi:hypothetical protein